MSSNHILLGPGPAQSKQQPPYLWEMESFGKKLNWDKYSEERESQSLCFDFSDSHLKTCFFTKSNIEQEKVRSIPAASQTKEANTETFSIDNWIFEKYLHCYLLRGTIRILKTFKIWIEI